MGRLLFKQPNGLYGRWSGIVDAFTHWNMTKEEYIQYRLNSLKEELEEDFKNGAYEKYDLDYIIDNEGYAICYRAYLEDSIEEDVFQPLRDMGASEDQINRMLEKSRKAKAEIDNFRDKE